MPKTGLTSEQIKDRAIECTIERMRKFGFEKVRLSDIAKDLGVTHAALYSHFSDKAALFDAVSERWLQQIDARLEEVCDDTKTQDALFKLTTWFLTLHRIKREKVRNDLELYKAYNYSAQIEKPFVQDHLRTMNAQLNRLAQEAIDAQLIHGDAKKVVSLIFEATMSFHHPVLVAHHVNEDREDLLRVILESLYKGLA